MRLDGEDLEVDFRAPRELEEFEGVLRYYQRLKEPAGWLRIRRPATRDPRPWLEADFGSMLGTTTRELRLAADEGTFRSIVSAGGPYIVMSGLRRSEWWGEYKKLKGPDEGYVVDAAGGPALILGSPDEVTWAPRPDGGVLVRMVSFDEGDTWKVAQHFAKIPSGGWKPLAKGFPVTDSLRCFDAALCGGAVGDRESLELRLAKGKYRIESQTWEPNDQTELLLVRFVRE
jgi:hypothetical protein